MGASDFDPVECPVTDCDYRDRIRQVAVHVGREDDADHAWDRLDYDDARDFVMAAKRRQRDGDGDGPESADGTATADETATPESIGMADYESSDEAEEEPDPFELGFERDALVLLALVREYDFETLSDLDAFRLANLYSLLADLRSSANAARKEVRDALLDELQDDREIDSDLGSVTRRTYQRRNVRDEEEVERALRKADVDPESVKSFDKSKLKEAVEEADVDPGAVFDFEEKTQIRKGRADDDRRRERFDRLPADVRRFVTDDEE